MPGRREGSGSLAWLLGAARRGAMLATLIRNPRRALAILAARLAGKRVRARQSLAALVGIDHRLQLAADRLPPTEPVRDLAAHGIRALRVSSARGIRTGGCDTGGSACDIVLILPPGHAPAAGAGAAIAGAFAAEPAMQALYGDAVAVGGRSIGLPILRPSFDADAARGLDLVGPCLALRSSALDAGTRLCPDWPALDAALRIDTRFGPGAVRHLPRVLTLHRLDAPRDRGEDGAEAADAARLACIRADLDRRGERETQARLRADGTVALARPLPERKPLVSLIVPTRDRLDLLKPCLTSLIERTDWPDKEILVCDNASREPETLAYLRALEADGLARVVAWPGPFDFAAMNNAAASRARGRLLAFVNNDVEAFEPGWLDQMVREALRPEVGAVGAKLLDGQGRIQHGGIVLGTGGGLATHGHRHFSGEAPGYLGCLSATHRVSAVTAACLVVEAEKFRRVGGFDAAAFAVDFNDVDLCLRLDAAGWRSLLVPEAVLHHREAASRVRSPEAAARHEREIAALKRRWGPRLAHDPHYHPGFDPDLSTHARLRPGWTGLDAAEPR